MTSKAILKGAFVVFATSFAASLGAETAAAYRIDEAEPAPRVFPFAMEGANLPNIWEMAGSREPAGSGGFLAVKGSDFVDATGCKRRFFGVNLYGPAALPAKADAPAMAERIARWGVNAVRLLPQYVWQLRADRDYAKGIDPDLLDRFDWLFFQLKQRGISVDMNLHSARTGRLALSTRLDGLTSARR